MDHLIHLKRKRWLIEHGTGSKEVTLAPMTSNQSSSSFTKFRGDFMMKMQLPPLKFKAGTHSELANFITDLEIRFASSKALQDDQSRVVYASSSLTGATKTRWNTHVRLHFWDK